MQLSGGFCNPDGAHHPAGSLCRGVETRYSESGPRSTAMASSAGAVLQIATTQACRWLAQVFAVPGPGPGAARSCGADRQLGHRQHAGS